MVKVVTIIPPEPKEGRATSSMGTKVLCDGKEIGGITNLTVRFDAAETIKAEMELFAYIKEVDAEPHFFMRHPFTNERKEITKIVFEDGTWLKL